MGVLTWILWNTSVEFTFGKNRVYLDHITLPSRRPWIEVKYVLNTRVPTKCIITYASSFPLSGPVAPAARPTSRGKVQARIRSHLRRGGGVMTTFVGVYLEIGLGCCHNRIKKSVSSDGSAKPIPVSWGQPRWRGNYNELRRRTLDLTFPRLDEPLGQWESGCGGGWGWGWGWRWDSHLDHHRRKIPQGTWASFQPLRKGLVKPIFY